MQLADSPCASAPSVLSFSSIGLDHTIGVSGPLDLIAAGLCEPILGHFQNLSSDNVDAVGNLDLLKIEVEPPPNDIEQEVGEIEPIHSNEVGFIDVKADDYSMKDPLSYDSSFTESTFPCSMCTRMFGSLQLLQRHQLSHNQLNKKYRCGLCPYATDRQSRLTDHQRTHTGETPFKCEVCGKEFSRRANFRRHSEFDHNEIPVFDCEICHKRFQRKEYLLAHKRVHTDERPYVCGICGKRFREGGGLAVHNNLHTKNKQYNCHFCENTFLTRTAMKCHELRIHTQAFRHRCSECGRGFATPSKLKIHKCLVKDY